MEGLVCAAENQSSYVSRSPYDKAPFLITGGGGGSWAVGQLNTKCCKQTYKHIYTENCMRMSVLYLNLKKNTKSRMLQWAS